MGIAVKIDVLSEITVNGNCGAQGWPLHLRLHALAPGDAALRSTPCSVDVWGVK